MAKPFNLTVALNLQGPNNVKKVVADIRRQLTGIKADVSLNIQADSAKNIANINKQLGSLSAAAKSANANVTSLGNALKQLSSGFSQTNNVAKTFNRTAADTSSNLKKSSKDVAEATTAIQDFGKQSALAVKRFAAFSIVTSIINRFSSAVTDSFQAFIAYERQLVRISQVTNGSKSDIQALSNEISKLAKNFGVASTDLAEVSVTLAQAGLSASQAKTALEALAKTSLAATFSDINSTTEGSIALMRQFKIGAQDLEAALGSINAVAGAFAVEAGDIITAISRAGGVFAAASKGVSEGKDALNEFVAVFTSVRATTRESAETIATGLRTIFTRIQRGSTIKFLREFGVELQDSQGKFVGAYEAIKRLSEGLQGLDPRDVRFTRIVEELGGFRQIGKVIPLVQEFATAQEALGVAQRGTASLSTDAIKAQLSLAVQFQQTREQFSALIREIGQSATFQTITKVVLGLASAFISVAGALKPILPLLTALTAVKGLKFITEFISGFKGGLGGGGIGDIGKTIGGALGGGGGDSNVTVQSQDTQNNTSALTNNTTTLTTLTGSVNQLNTTLNNVNTVIANAINAIGKISAGGNYPEGLTFAKGGSVPGTGNRDTVSAMLTPGEFVIRKKAVQAIGVDNLAKMNKYANGGIVVESARVPKNPIDIDQLKNSGLAPQTIGAIKGIAFETDFAKAYNTTLNQASQFPDITDPNIANQVVKGAEGLELKYENNSSTLAKYKSSLNKSGKDSSDIPMVTRAAKGGKISGSDTVPALLTPGEFVLNKKSAQKLGGVTLNKLNNADKIQGFNKGGAVGFINGGQVTAEDGSAFTPGGGKVDPTLIRAIDRLDANLRGLGSVMQETIVATDADVSMQAELVERFEDLVGAVNRAEAGGDEGEIKAAKEDLRSEIRYMIDGLADFKRRYNIADQRKQSPGGLGYPGSMQKMPQTIKQTETAFQRVTRKIDALSNVTGSFVGTFSGGLAAVIPQIDKLVASFDNLNNTTIAMSAEFKAFRGALEQGASRGLSASIAAQQAGLGRRGAAIAGGLGFAGGAVSGAIAGASQAREAEFRAQGGAASVRMERAKADFGESESQRERLESLADFTQASAEYSNSIDAANREYMSSTARAGRAVGQFTDALIAGLSALGGLRAMRGGRRFANGGVVYASSGTLVDYQPKGTDTVPAMLTPGEFVVNAKSTKKNMGLLKAINKSRGGIVGGVQYLQEGGLSSDSSVERLASSVDKVAGSLENASQSMDKSSKDVEKSGERWGGAVGDFVTGTSDSTATNVASFAVKSAAGGVVPYAGAALDYASAYTNFQRGDYTGAAIDALFGTIDAVTDTVQAAGYATGIGAPVAAGGGAALQVATDTTQAGLKKGIKEFPKLLKSYVTPAFKNFKDTIVKAGTGFFGKVRGATKSVGDFGGSIFGKIGGLFGKRSGKKAAGQTSSAIDDMVASGYISESATRGTQKPGFLKRMFGFGGGGGPRKPGSPRRRGFGGGGRRGGRFGGLLNFGLNALAFGAAAAPGIASAYSEATGSDLESKVRMTQAAESRFGRIAEGARMRGGVGRLESPVAQRAVERFKTQREDGGSLESQRRVLGQLAGSEQASAGFVQEQARQEALRAKGLQLRPDQTVEEFLQSDEYNKLTDEQKQQAQEAIKTADKKLARDAFITAKMKEYTAAGLTAEQAQARLNEELKASTDENGDLIGAARKRAELEIGIQEEIAAKAARAAREMAQFNKQTASLTAIMSRLSAGMKRVGDEINHIVAQTDSYTNALQGNATAVASVAASGATRDAEVLGNLSAYSSQELEQTLGRVTAGLGGSEPIQQAGELVKAQQVLEKIRPSIEAALKESGGSALSQDDVAKMLEKGFEGVNIDESIKESFIDAASRQITAGGDGAKNIDAFLAKSAQAQKLLQEYSQLSANGLKKLAEQSDKLTQSLMRTTELQIKKGEIEINAANNLKQALGFKLTPGEQVAASQARVKALTGGETDPERIFEDLTMDLDKRRAIEEAGPEAVRAATTSGELAELNKSIAQSRQALEFLANDTTAADAALQRIADRDKQLRQQSETALDLASDPTKALEFIGQAQSLSRVLSGQGGQMDIAGGRAALNQLEGMIPQEQFDALRERFFQGTGASLGLGAEMAPFAAGAASTMEGKAKDPIIAAEMKNLEEINAVRKSAMDQLIALEQASANALTGSITAIDNQLTQTLGPLVESINTELEKFRNGVAAANAGGAAPAAPEAPPPAAPAAPAPGAIPPPPQAPAQQASVTAPAGRLDMITAAATTADAYANAGVPIAEQVTAAAANTLQAQGSVDLVPKGAMNVVVSFAANEAEMFGKMGEAMKQELGSKIANAILEQSNRTIDIRGAIA